MDKDIASYENVDSSNLGKKIKCCIDQAGRSIGTAVQLLNILLKPHLVPLNETHGINQHNSSVSGRKKSKKDNSFPLSSGASGDSLTGKC